MVLNLAFCVRRATLSYSGHLRLLVDTTVSDQKAEWEINSPNTILKLKKIVFLNSLQCINRFCIILYTAIYTYTNTSLETELLPEQQ